MIATDNPRRKTVRSNSTTSRSKPAKTVTTTRRPRASRAKKPVELPVEPAVASPPVLVHTGKTNAPAQAVQREEPTLPEPLPSLSAEITGTFSVTINGWSPVMVELPGCFTIARVCGLAFARTTRTRTAYQSVGCSTLKAFELTAFDATRRRITATLRPNASVGELPTADTDFLQAVDNQQVLCELRQREAIRSSGGYYRRFC